MTATRKILVIDDEPFLRETLAIILQDEGYGVATAANAREALQNLQNEPFDLVFLDIKMPEVSGLDLLPEIRNLSPDIPIIMLTAYASLTSAIEAMRKGANDYLFKPIDPPEILERVNRMMSESELPRRRQAIVQEMRNLLTELDQTGRVFSETAVPPWKKQVLAPDRFIQRGHITVDLQAKQVMIHDKVVPLTPTTFDYLVTLMKHSPETISCEQLVFETQNYKLDHLEANDLVRGRIHELRKAIEEDSRNPRHIITVRGIGYRLVT